MIPDYSTFICQQDRINLFFIYLVTLVLIGFYWKNAEFSFSRHDVWYVCGILALVFHSFIVDLKAYWAYKYVVRNVDLSSFINKTNAKIEIIMFKSPVAGSVSLLIFAAFASVLLLFSEPDTVLLILAVCAPLMIWGMFAFVRHGYIKQVAISFADKVRWQSLFRYMLPGVLLSITTTLLTISPLRYSKQFDLYGHYFTPAAIVAMSVLCAIVFAISQLSLIFSKRYIFLGYLFLNQIDLTFSTAIPLRSLFEKPLWLQLAILICIEIIWIIATALAVTLTGWQVWFEIYFLLCYLPCLGYYMLRCYWKWHSDYLMSCDMYIRWGEISKQTRWW